MNDIILTQKDSLTMSSEQIAKLLELRHDNVRQSAKNLAAHGVIAFTEISVKGNGRPKQVMQFDKRNSIVIAAKLNDKFMARVVDRWLELEDSTKQRLPDFTNAVLMARTWADDQEEKQRLKIESDLANTEVYRLQGVCQTITAQFYAGVTATKFCKQFNGVNTQQVNNALIGLGLLTRKRDGVVPTAYSRDRYFAEKQEEHNGKLRSHSALTLKGAKWLYSAYLSNKLPMKNNWDGKFVHVVFEG